ncbi:T9SS type A sorting domain-containing protein [Chryseobacterium oncorhynchi]|uniref:Secretion system C-terminal sorting domain-containing protein n=1 Tax=Chryseobacterium oncorhynchi TaxID=741074 RepID=A0A316X761_9FLAO|nr:T9SS type A sorting domain-containing protein [Chryseobacterium oncorhynchi]PWN66590.1 hypothetical protein C1638_009585 [Chryseobacterium oncorhynchi]
MKKLFTFLPLFLAIYSYGQAIATEDFNQYTLGDLGTDTTGSIPGQGGHYIKNGSTADYQIIEKAVNDKALYLTTGNSYTSVPNMWVDPPVLNSNARVIKKAITTNAASNNNVILGSIDFFTGSANGKGELMFYLLEDQSGVVNGAQNGIVGISFDYTTKKIKGYGKGTYTWPAVFGQRHIFNTVYPDNTWIHVSFQYDKALGIDKFTTPNEEITISTGVTLGKIPVEMRIVATTNDGNTVQNYVGVDNVNLRFTNNGDLSLGVSEASNTKSDISVYPSPVSDYLHINSKEKIMNVELFDISGKLINVSWKENIVDLRSLKSGNYIISVKNKKETFSRKIIKK